MLISKCPNLGAQSTKGGPLDSSFKFSHAAYFHDAWKNYSTAYVKGESSKLYRYTGLCHFGPLNYTFLVLQCELRVSYSKSVNFVSTLLKDTNKR